MKGVVVGVDAGVRERLVRRFGAGVLGWCDALPGVVGELADRWELDVVAAGGGGTSRVFRCLRRDGGGPVWLKVTPDPVIAQEEAEALRGWGGRPSAVALLGEEPGAGALLLAEVGSGAPVRQSPRAVSEVAALLRGLREPSVAPPGAGERSAVRPLTDRVGFVFDLTGRRMAAARVPEPVDPAVLARGRRAAMELAGGGPVGLVHGDLHPGNVLSGADGRLVAIDPRPAWGDPDFDTVDWVLEGAGSRDVLERRTEELAALVPGMSVPRVLAWCRALAVLFVVPRVCAGREDDAETRFLMALAGLHRD